MCPRPTPTAAQPKDHGIRHERRVKIERRQTIDPAEASFFSSLQGMLVKRSRALPGDLSRICGVDAAYDGDRVFAVACLFDMGRFVAKASYEGSCSLPYVSGLFYLREGPFAVAAVGSLGPPPQLVCFDAHGAAHPRSAGLATVCGMVLGIPSVGIAKSLLVGEVSEAKGLARIVYRGETVGFATTTEGAKRYWSSGYSVTPASLESIIKTRASTCLRAMSEADGAAKQARSSFIRRSRGASRGVQSR